MPRRRLSRLVLAALALSTACGGDSPQPSTARPVARARPRLVVLLVVDGLPRWSFDRKVRDSHAGFARLLREGVDHEAAALPYAATYTAPGHAALVTGGAPAVTGIVSNRWYDRQLGAEVDAIADADQPILDVTGRPGGERATGASPHRLLVDSVGDALSRSTGGRARVVSLSIKRHAAVLMGGRRPTAAFWLDEGQVAFTTSRYYGETAPAWLRELAARHPIAPRLSRYVWRAADPARLAAVTGLGDDAPGERGLYGLGPVFPHRPAGVEEPAKALATTPLANDLLLEAALAAIGGERLGQDEVPDLLCVSFSTHDLIGHGWGQESWESRDEFAHLDEVVGRLLDELDVRVGRGRWALVFSSDHGTTPVVEQSVAAGRAARRVDPDALGKAMATAARAAAGPGEWIADSREQHIYLTPAARALPQARKDALLDALLETLRATPGIGLAVRGDALAAGCDALPEPEALFCRSFHPDRSGDILYSPSAGSVVMEKPWDTSTHGSISDDDRRVPLVVVEPGVASRRNRRPVSTLQVAPTLARLLGIAPPSHASAPPL